MTALCTVAHFRDPERPRRTPDGFTICAGCANGLGNHLKALPRLHDDLLDLHTAQRGRQQTRVSGSTGRRLPIALSVADARTDIRDAVTAWTVYAAAEAANAGVADTWRWLALDVTTGAGWLALHADWCVSQPWASDLVTAIRRVHSRAVRLLDPRPVQFFPIPGTDGLCVRDIDDTPCPGRMWVTIPEHEEESSAITCDTCEHVYAATSWLRLGKMVHARRVAA